MGITELPVLPAEYPLFDWADWPESYAALVPGGPTKAFQKACWNAIVNYMAEAVEAAGLQWRNGTQDPEYIQMLGEGNIRLKAQMMNILMRAVDDVVQLPWRWEYDTSFRGYIGRQFFHFDINMEKDVVYPEYFTELVSHINRVVEIMRGTTQTNAIEAEYLADSISRVYTEKKRAGPASVINRIHSTNLSAASESVVLGELIDFPKHISSVQVSGPVWLNGEIIEKRIRTNSETRASATKLKAGAMTASTAIKSLQYAALDYWRDFLETQASLQVYSLSRAAIIQAPTGDMSATVKAGTSAAAAMVQRAIRELAPESVTAFFSIRPPDVYQIRMGDAGTAKHLIKSSIYAEAMKSETLPIAAEGHSRSSQDADAVLIQSMQGAADQRSRTEKELTVSGSRSKAIRKEQQSKISAKTPIQLYAAGPVFSEKATKASVVCGLDILNWEYPVWVDGGLWIRQAYYVEQNENGELEVR